MNASYEFAKILMDLKGAVAYSPVEGRIEALPEVKIRLNDKVVLGGDLVRSTVDILKQNGQGEYIWLNRRVYLLPCYNGKRIIYYLVIGGDAL